MATTQKKKLCWNCEASVDLHVENCPYCAVYLGPASASDSSSIEDPLTPPYKIQVTEEEELPEAPYVAGKQESGEELEGEFEPSGDVKEVALPMGLLLSGTVFFLFGLILFLFSDHGVFTLHWNGEYWYLYQLLALPLLYFGWNRLQYLDQPTAVPVKEKNFKQR